MVSVHLHALRSDRAIIPFGTDECKEASLPIPVESPVRALQRHAGCSPEQRAVGQDLRQLVNRLLVKKGPRQSLTVFTAFLAPGAVDGPGSTVMGARPASLHESCVC